MRCKKRLLLTIIERQAFPKEEIRVDFLDFCIKNILSTGEPASTRSLCAKMAYYQCVHYQELLSELNNVIQLALSDKLTRGVESSFKKILKKNQQLPSTTIGKEEIRSTELRHNVDKT